MAKEDQKTETIALSVHNEAIAKLTAENEALRADLATAEEVTADALKQFNDNAGKVAKANTIKIGSKVHTVNFGVEYNGVKYSAEELSNNEAVVKELIEIGSGAISVKEGK